MINLLFISYCVYVFHFDFLLGQCQQQILSIRHLLALTQTDVIDTTLVYLDSYTARRQCIQSYSIYVLPTRQVYMFMPRGGGPRGARPPWNTRASGWARAGLRP